jgi:hypothetical protein
MPAREVVEMVLERGEGRNDVVVAGLRDIALAGKVRSQRLSPIHDGTCSMTV